MSDVDDRTMPEPAESGPSSSSNAELVLPRAIMNALIRRDSDSSGQEPHPKPAIQEIEPGGTDQRLLGEKT